MRRVDRYLLEEVAAPFWLGCLAYTSILLAQRFFSLAELIIRRGVPSGTVLELLLYSLPNIFVLTLPMAFLLGVLLGVGRLAADSELVALRASGMSLWQMLRPISLFAAVLAVLNVFLMLYLLPRGNQAYSRLLLEMVERSNGSQIEPRSFFNEFQGKVLWIFDGTPEGRWRGVFLSDSVPAGLSRTWIAAVGRLQFHSGIGQALLELEDAVEHAYDLGRPDTYQISRHKKTVSLVRDRLAAQERQRWETRKSVRAMTLEENLAASEDPTLPEELRILARIEVQKKFAIPAAILVFAFLALPLGFSNRRGSKASGFALAMGVVAGYHLLLTQGEEAARVGHLSPALAVWIPNLVCLVLGGTLLWVRNRDLRWHLRWPSWQGAIGVQRVRDALQLLRKRQAPEARTLDSRPRPGEQIPSLEKPLGQSSLGSPANGFRIRIPRIQTTFPTRLDRYVFSTFFRILPIVLGSGLLLTLLADLSERLDDILRNRPKPSVLFDFYKYLSFQAAFQIGPFVVLITALVALGILARNYELLACKSLGISLYRIGLPALAAAALCALGSAWLEAEVLPASNQRKESARRIIRGQPEGYAVSSPHRNWLFSRERFLYNYLSYDRRTQSLVGIQVFEFDTQHRLIGRLYADRGQFRGGVWILEKGWIRRFQGERTVSFRQFEQPVAVDIPESPDFFAALEPRPEELRFGELKRRISDLRASGQPRPDLEVALHNKFAYPAGAVALVLAGLPFAFRLERRGPLYGLGLALIVGMVYLAIYALFKTLGEVGVLPPVVAVWGPGVLFSAGAGYFLLGVRS